MTLYKRIYFILSFLLLLLVGSQLFDMTKSGHARSVAETYLQDKTPWFQSAAENGRQADLRIKLASSPLFEAIAIWDADKRLLFPNHELPAHLIDEVFLSNHRRLETLLTASQPTAWEPFDVNADALFYCQRGSISVCLSVNTDELTTQLDISKKALLSALFPSDSAGVGWKLYLLLLPLLGLTLLIRFKPFRRGVTSEASTSGVTFMMGDMEVDPRRMRITRDDFSADISARDLKLLTCLFEHPDEVLTKDKLYNVGWGRDFMPSSRSLEQHIMTLRKKIDPERKRLSLIETVHGQGYRYPIV